MSVLISSATGNLTAAGTWSLVDATSYNNSEAANTALTVASVASTPFTPPAVALDAIALKIASVTGSGPSGTITVELFNVTTAAVAATLTINVTDLPSCAAATAEGGWAVFKFGATVTPNGTDSYSVRAKTSIASGVSTVNLFSLATTNWSRALRTTTNQAPVAGDDMIVAGAWTAAATLSSFTVTNDQTVNTNYGSGSTSQAVPALSVCKGGTLVFSKAAAANPYLKLSGCTVIYNGGTVDKGKSGTTIPSGSVAVIEYNCAADGDFGTAVRNGGVFSDVAVERTAGKLVTWCLLNADAAANATSLTVDRDTGWLSGDEIAVAGTNRPGSQQAENGTLNGNATSTVLTVNGFAGTAGGVLNSHLGGSTVNSSATVTMPDGTTKTAKMQAEVINLTRNSIYRSALSTAMTYLSAQPNASVTLGWTRFRYLGANVTGKHGIDVDISAGGFLDIQNCAFDQIKEEAIRLFQTTTNSYPAQVKNNVFYNCGGIAGSFPNAIITVQTAKTGGNAGYVIDSNVSIKSSSGSAMTINDITGTVTNNRFTGMNGGSLINLNQQATVARSGGFDGNVSHSNNHYESLRVTQWSTADFAGWTIWRNSEADGSIYCNLAASQLRFSNFAMWGNQWGFVAAACLNVWIKDSFLCGDTSNVATSAIFMDGAAQNFRLDNVAFGDSNNFLTAVSSDFIVGSAATLQVNAKIVGRNVRISGTTALGPNAPQLLTDDGYISIEKLNGTAGNHKTWLQGGTITLDTTIFNVASPSQRLAPTSASAKLPTAPVFRGIKITVTNGVAGQGVSVWVRKSVVGDGAAYNGNQPRLIQRANYALGQTADVVLATAAATAGTWEKLTGTISTPNDNGAFEFIVDCDGTAGWVNVDDWTAV